MLRRSIFCAVLLHASGAWASLAEDQLEIYQRCLSSAERSRELAFGDRQLLARAQAGPVIPIPPQFPQALARLRKLANIPAGVQLQLVGVHSNGTASVLSSGTIFVSTRLWRGRLALDAEEAAAVLAHEIAHVELSHVRNRFCEAVAASGDESIPLLDANEAAQQAVMASGNSQLAVRMMQNNHERELSADRRAGELLKAAGIPGTAVKTMLLKLAGSGGGAQYSWSHPALETRLENLGMMKGHGAPY